MAALDKLKVLEDWLLGGVWFEDLGTEFRLVGITIKIQPGGHLAILKAVTAEGPRVAFLQLRDIDRLRTLLRDAGGRDCLRWREDKYKLDKNDQVG